ncbi:pantoate--beta-alanine ligase [Opitutus sp. ER46]|uniref:pantoate--beta-alanine ligase n=1 Tax=Opitutus sp. ER46 TaxID=2161864 RepID=UPI000D2FF13F|nr:pantoate--beta-alanine ligase [Opitutus sp. ER46]PTX97884.1 pantoate--beta-alanine ligase [Opitutus sp. ER46]
MLKIESVSEMRSYAAQLRAAGQTIALVPTQGALHAGQEGLIRAAAQRADSVVVSIFVNPLQFPPNEIVARYPRSLEADFALCERCGAHVAFVPAAEEIYPKGFSTYVVEEHVAKPLDGVSRPTHFRGVTTLMAKLINIIHPTFAFFGQKTAQRAAVVRKMCDDLGFPVEVIVEPTVREPDGLAAGVHNRSLTVAQRIDAVALHAAVEKARTMVAGGVRSPDRIVAEATHILGERRRIRVIYISIVDPVTLEAQREVVPGHSMLAIAVWIDEVRLLDNVLL